MKLLAFLMLPAVAVAAAVVEPKALEPKPKQLRRGLKMHQLYDVAAPLPGADEVAKAVEDINKAKEDEEFWNRLLSATEGSMHEDECRFPGFGVC